MKKAILILCLSATYMVSCGGNEESTDDHGHEHGDHEHGNHEHGDHEDGDHEHDHGNHENGDHDHHDHDQETFTVEDDSLTNE